MEYGMENKKGGLGGGAGGDIQEGKREEVAGLLRSCSMCFIVEYLIII